MDEDELLMKIEKDLYFGNGPKDPSITSRLISIEECLKDYKWLKRLSIATLVTVLADLITKHLK